jgi:hypothetical protein
LEALRNIGLGSDPGSESGIRDPGTGKTLSRIQGSKKHRITNPDPQHWLLSAQLFVVFFFTHDWFIIFRMGHEKPTEEALSTANSEASELKEKGNEAYKNDNLDEALAFYTQGNFFAFKV